MRRGSGGPGRLLPLPAGRLTGCALAFCASVKGRGLLTGSSRTEAALACVLPAFCLRKASSCTAMASFNPLIPHDFTILLKPRSDTSSHWARWRALTLLHRQVARLTYELDAQLRPGSLVREVASATHLPTACLCELLLGLCLAHARPSMYIITGNPSQRLWHLVKPIRLPCRITL